MKTSQGIGPVVFLTLLVALATACPASSQELQSGDLFTGLIDLVGSHAPTLGPPSADGAVELEPFGAVEGSVIDPSGGVLFVRFDPPFGSPFTLESVSFLSRTRNGVPAVFPSVRICRADATGQPDLSSPLFSQSPFEGSSDGPNTIPVNLLLSDPGSAFFVAIEFPLRGSTYPLNHPGIASDFFDLDRGYFSATYFLPTSGLIRQLDFVNAVVSAKCRPTGPATPPAEAPTNLSANRIGESVIFSFEKPGRAPTVGYELLRRGSLGPWTLVSFIGPGHCTFAVDSLPLGRSRWAVRSVGPFGNSSQLSNVEVLDPLTRVFPQTSWGPEEPNGEFSEALPPVYIPEASIFPSGDRDFYSFTAHAGDLVRISAGPSGGLFADRDTLDLAAVLYDDHGRRLAFDDNSVLGRFPQIEYRVPRGRRGGLDQRYVVEIFDVRGSRFAPGTCHRPASSPSYWYGIETVPPGASDAAAAVAEVLRADSNRTSPLTIEQGSGRVRFLIGDQAAGVAGSLRLFDARGRLLKVLEVGQGTGTRVFEWTGHDDGGRKVAMGVYFASLTSGGTRITRKFIFAK